MQDENNNLIELDRKNDIWNKKLLLRKIYNAFYMQIKENLYKNNVGKIVEVGSGIGKLKKIIPECVCSDQFCSSYVNSIENAYDLSYVNDSVSNLILFDVFHHLKYPGDALNEFHRVLIPSGRVIIFEPYMSLLGIIVYGIFHEEPIALTNKIEWKKNKTHHIIENEYYTAQGNASRIFFWEKGFRINKNWKIIKFIKMPAISYVASGGYTGKQLYPQKLLSFMQIIDRILSCLPSIFATRVLIILEKKQD